MPRKFGRSAKVEIVNFTILGDMTTTIHTQDGKSVVGGSAGVAGKTFGDGIRITFDVTKSLDFSANQAQIQIYNLTEETRKKISGVVELRTQWTQGQRLQLSLAGANTDDPTLTYTNLGMAYIRLLAGYQGDLGLLMEGTSERIQHFAEPPNIVTLIDLGDNAIGIREGTINESWGPGTAAVDVIEALVNAMGANVAAAQKTRLAALNAQLTAIDFPKGVSLVGQAHPFLTEAMRLLEIDWSFQDGEFVILGKDEVLPEPPILLQERTGLVGQPRQLENDSVEVTALLDAGIKPGRAVQLLSRQVEGFFRVNTAKSTGDTHTGSNHTVAELDKVQPGL